MSSVLVVDDKEMLRDSVGATLRRAGFGVVAASGAEAALSAIAKRRPDAVVTDLKMPGMSGLELLERIREFDEDLPVILMTAYGAVETAVEAMRLGAYTYLTKPFEGDELVVNVKRAIEHARLRRENEVLRRAGDEASAEPGDAGVPPAGDEAPSAPPGRGLDRLIGASGVMADLKEQVRSIAASHGSTLIHGESGVGKEVVARAIHELSPRSGEAFLAMNCAALSESLLESELFGHEKGAFTGAERLRKGRFELADRGTLLLDEVSEVSPSIQAKLLRVLQEQSFERVGSSVTIGVDVRVIATSNRDLPAEVERGDFRGDLFFRLNVLPIHIPPLRERLEDVEPLATHFIARVCAREGRPTKSLTPAAVDLLRSYHWPGNVRELQNICERAVVLSAADRIEADLLRGWLGGRVSVRPAAAQATLERRASDRNGTGLVNGHASEAARRPAPCIMGDDVRSLEEIERQAILEALERFDGHRQKTAKALGIGVRTLGLKLKKWKEENLVSASV